MSLSKKQPTISIPEYRQPAQPNFSAYGQTAQGVGNGGYSLSQDPTQIADMQAASKVRNELIGSLGLSPNTDQYKNTFYNESLRLSQPQLENSLIQRGLGGSSVYQGALTDLLNKAATDSILNAGNQQTQAQNNKLNTLSGLQSSYFGPNQQLGEFLLQLAGGTDISQDQLAQQLYQMQLPYNAQVNYPKESGLGGGLMGALKGGLSGSAFGPIGAIGGAIGGGATGYYGAQAPAYSSPLAFYGGVNNYNAQGGTGGLTLQSLQQLLNGGRAFGS